jgi:hypothetical protein
MPLFRADTALMEQVIANLLLNAAHHTPATTPIFLAAGVDLARARVTFTVADRGPGLPPTMRDRLFQKFQRGDAARAGGLGLGLSIIRGFVARRAAKSSPGKIPAAAPSSPSTCPTFPTDRSLSNDPRRRPKPDILVIDDEIQIRRLLRLTLETAGYRVREAETGALGLNEAAVQPSRRRRPRPQPPRHEWPRSAPPSA